MKPKTYSVDPKSYELAVHFLSDLDEEDGLGKDPRELAQAIQDAVEDWFCVGCAIPRLLPSGPASRREGT